MNTIAKKDLSLGMAVRVVQKNHQRTGELTEGIIGRFLTNSPTHPHGIKVMLEDGRVGRVQEIVE